MQGHPSSETDAPSRLDQAQPFTPPRTSAIHSLAASKSPVTPTVRDPALQSPTSTLRRAALSFDAIPSIFKRKAPGSHESHQVGVHVADWNQVKRARNAPTTPRRIPKGQTTPVSMARQSVQKASKQSKAKSANPGRTYTSKYRGVHQTFPTKRWEAQFRRNGKPTSLGCFDLETEAAKAYDKMMLWCELHQNLGMKGGITNFDASEYERDLEHLQNISQRFVDSPTLAQEELVQSMRSEGRRQATQRIMRAKRDGQMAFALMNRLDGMLDNNGSPGPRRAVRRTLDMDAPTTTDSENHVEGSDSPATL